MRTRFAPFDASRDSTRDYETSPRHGQDVEQNGLPYRRAVSIPVSGGIRRGEIAAHRRHEVLEHPPGDDRVVEHDHHARHGDEPAHPRRAAAGQPGECPNRSAARAPAQSELGNQQRNRPGEQKEQPRNEKGAAAVLGRDAGKAPQVAGTDGHPQTGQDDAPAGREEIGRLHRMLQRLRSGRPRQEPRCICSRVAPCNAGASPPSAPRASLRTAKCRPTELPSGRALPDSPLPVVSSTLRVSGRGLESGAHRRPILRHADRRPGNVSRLRSPSRFVLRRGVAIHRFHPPPRGARSMVGR